MWCDLDEANGVRYDAHGSHDFADTGTVPSTSDGGRTVADFIKANLDYLRATHHADIEPNAENYSFTICFKPDATGGIRSIVSKDGNPNGYTLYLNGTRLWHNHQNVDGVDSTLDVSNGTWYHCVVTYNATSNELKIYVNNVLKKTYTIDYVTSTGNLNLGGYNNTTSYCFDGKMKNYGFYKGRILDVDDVALLWNDGEPLDYEGTAGEPAVTYDVDADEPTNVSYFSARMNGSYTTDGGENATITGFVLDSVTHAKPADSTGTSTAYGGRRTTNGEVAPGSFYNDYASFPENATWYYRAWIYADGLYRYSEEEQTITTTILGLTYDIDEPTNLDNTSITLNATWETVATENATIEGFAWGTTSFEEDLADNIENTPYDAYFKDEDTHTEGSFLHNVTGLTPNTTYYARAYLRIAGRTYWSDEITFTTPALVHAISGVVTKQGTPVEGATVRIIDQDLNEVAETAETTDANGAYTFEGLDSAKTYHVICEYSDETGTYYTYSYWNIEPYQLT